MNKFKKLASKLIGNKLWCTEIIYCITSIKNEDYPLSGIIDHWLIGNSYNEDEEIMIKSMITMKVVMKNVSKNLVDNTSILNTDSSFVMDSETLGKVYYDLDTERIEKVEPKIRDRVKIKGVYWRIVKIIPLGILDGEPTAYEIIIRKLGEDSK